jgi:hypothetical protein
MTGETLLRQLRPVDPATMPAERAGRAYNLPREALAEIHTMNNVAYFQGYVESLYDATEGTTWCYNAKAKTPKPDTFMEESEAGLKRLSPDQLKRGAADLLVEIWRARWPCPERRRQQ